MKTPCAGRVEVTELVEELYLLLSMHCCPIYQIIAP